MVGSGEVEHDNGEDRVGIWRGETWTQNMEEMGVFPKTFLGIIWVLIYYCLYENSSLISDCLRILILLSQANSIYPGYFRLYQRAVSNSNLDLLRPVKSSGMLWKRILQMACCSPWVCRESDLIERMNNNKEDLQMFWWMYFRFPSLFVDMVREGTQKWREKMVNWHLGTCVHACSVTSVMSWAPVYLIMGGDETLPGYLIIWERWTLEMGALLPPQRELAGVGKRPSRSQATEWGEFWNCDLGRKWEKRKDSDSNLP